MSVFFLSLFPACLAACVSVSIPVCAVGPMRLSQSADYTHDKPNFLLALHSGSFQALRVPSPGFLSSFLLSLPSFTLSFLPSAAVEPAVLRHCIWGKKAQNADFRLLQETQQVGARGFSRLRSVMMLIPPQPPRLPLETCVLYHQLYQVASQCDEGNKTPIWL